MRVLLAASGSRGDVAPFLSIACALRERGHDVTFCASPNFSSWVERNGVPFRPCGSDLRAILASKAEVIRSHPIRVLREAAGIIREELALHLEVLREEAARADLIVATVSEFAAPIAAEESRVAYRSVVCCPLLIPARDHPPVLFPFAGLPEAAHRLLWAANKSAWNFLLRGPVDRHRRALGLRSSRDLWGESLGSAPILAADPILAPAPRRPSVEVRQTGALLFDEPAPLDRELESFLSDGPPPVYIGFGSMTDADAASTSAILSKAVRTAGVRAVISSGWAQLSVVGDAAIRTVGEVSHARLFPRVAAVVHHGGAGTTATAARVGVPQLIVPHFLDQHYWARRVSALGLGPAPVPRKRLNAESLAAAIRLCISDPVLRIRAADVAKRMKRDAVVATVEELTRGWNG